MINGAFRNVLQDAKNGKGSPLADNHRFNVSLCSGSPWFRNGAHHHPEIAWEKAFASVSLPSGTSTELIGAQKTTRCSPGSASDGHGEVVILSSGS